MAKIANKTRNDFRASLSNASLPVEIADKELDNLIRGVRKTVLRSVAENMAAQVQVMLAVLRPFRDCFLDEAEKQGFDTDR